MIIIAAIIFSVAIYLGLLSIADAIFKGLVNLANINFQIYQSELSIKMREK